MGEEGVRDGASRGEVHEDPDQEDGHEDGPTRAADEACRPRQGEAEEESPGRKAVGGSSMAPSPGPAPRTRPRRRAVASPTPSPKR